MKPSPLTNVLAAVLLAPSVCVTASAVQSTRTPMRAEPSEPSSEKLPAVPTPVVERSARPSRESVREWTAANAAVHGEPRAPAALLTRAAGIGFDHVEYDAPGDGWLWARGATYKAGFSADDALYAPFLGSNAPRNYPVHLCIASVSIGGASIAFDPTATPEHTGNIVRYERGSFVEQYALDLASIEQTFVFGSLPRGSSGDLVLRIATRSELAGRETADALEFTNELGSVRYGRATALDASGARVPAATTLTADGIEIRVSADFVAHARLPLTIDPLVSGFVIDSSPLPDYHPDVAGTSYGDQWLAVFEEAFSATDHDVRWRSMGASSGGVQTGYIDVSLSSYWAHPACAAANADQSFLVVAEVGLPSSGARTIQGRLVSHTGVTSPGIAISLPDASGDKFNPDVSGDSFLDDAYLVVWERDFGASDHDIHYRRVSSQGLPFGTSTGHIENGNEYDYSPSVSKSMGHGGIHNIVWARRTSPTNSDIRGARINFDGTIAHSSFSIDSSSADTVRPTASSILFDPNRWAVAWVDSVAFDSDIHVALMHDATVIDLINLSGLEELAGSSSLTKDQGEPDIDSDSDTFAVVYTESAVAGGGGDYDIYAATLGMTGDRLELSEGHQPIGIEVGALEESPKIAALGFVDVGSGEDVGLRHYMTVWMLHIVGTIWISGAVYDSALYTSFCHPGLDGIEPCPCGNPPSAYGRGCDNSASTGGALLTASGTPSLSADTMLLTSSGELSASLSLFTQGTGVAGSGLVFGQGVRCTGGTIKRLYSKTASAGMASAPNFITDMSISARSAAVGNPILPSTTRSYFVYYRDPIVLGACLAASKFNATQALQAIWIP